MATPGKGKPGAAPSPAHISKPRTLQPDDFGPEYRVDRLRLGKVDVALGYHPNSLSGRFLIRELTRLAAQYHVALAATKPFDAPSPSPVPISLFEPALAWPDESIEMGLLTGNFLGVDLIQEDDLPGSPIFMQVCLDSAMVKRILLHKPADVEPLAHLVLHDVVQAMATLLDPSADIFGEAGEPSNPSDAPPIYDALGAEVTSQRLSEFEADWADVLSDEYAQAMDAVGGEAE